MIIDKLKIGVNLPKTSRDSWCIRWNLSEYNKLINGMIKIEVTPNEKNNTPSSSPSAFISVRS